MPSIDDAAAIAAIHRLPSELLTIAFFNYLDQSRDHERETLACVCRAWKALVANSPILWSRITIDLVRLPQLVDPAALVRRQLQRARQCSLDIVFCIQRAAQGVQAVVEDVYRLIQSHRWRKLSIVTDDMITRLEIFAVLTRHLTSHPRECGLSSLNLDIASSVFAVDEGIAAALTELPDLTELAIPIVLLPPTHVVYPRIRKLELLNCYRPRPSDHLAILRNCSQLQSLLIRDGYGPMRGEVKECLMESLETLAFKDVDVFPSFFLRHMRLPKLRVLSLVNIKCTMQEGGRVIQELPSQVSWLPQLKELMLNNVSISDTTVLWLLSRLPALVRLHLSRSTGIKRSIVDALALPGITEPEWLCPSLEQVEFVSCPFLVDGDLEHLVEARVRDVVRMVEQAADDGHLAAPAPLNKVVWNGTDMIAVMKQRWAAEEPAVPLEAIG